MNKPLIGIVGKPQNTDKRFHYILVNDEIKNRILENGGLPIGILPLDNKFKFIGEGNKVIDQLPKYGEKVEEGSTIVIMLG